MSVSLLPSQAKFQLAKIRLKKKLFVATVIILSVWLVASLGIWTWWIINNRQLSLAKNKLDSVTLEYKNRSEDLLTSHKLKYQAKMVANVLATRFEYGEAITNVNNLLPAAITIENFKIEGKNSFLINYLTSSEKNIDVLEQKIAEIKNKKVEGFANAKLVSISRDGNDWKFSLEVETK